MDWRSFEHKTSLDKKVLRKSWGNDQFWKGTFCDGGFRYNLEVGARITNVKIELNEDGSFYADVDLDSLFAGVGASYISDYSLCSLLRGSYRARGNRGQVRALVTFVERGPDLPPTISVRILSMKMSRIQILGDMPDWFDDAVTQVVNYTFERIWSSELGTLLSSLVTKEVEKYFPKKEDKMLNRA